MKLRDIAHSRTGDKGNVCNISVIAYREDDYALLREAVTAERVKAHFGGIVQGEVVRYELPGIAALNFVLKEALGGGVTRSLRLISRSRRPTTSDNKQINHKEEWEIDDDERRPRQDEPARPSDTHGSAIRGRPAAVIGIIKARLNFWKLWAFPGADWDWRSFEFGPRPIPLSRIGLTHVSHASGGERATAMGLSQSRPHATLALRQRLHTCCKSPQIGTVDCNEAIRSDHSRRTRPGSRN
jgi:hypothetical protein